MVVKVGGSLLDWAELPARLIGYLERWQGCCVLVIVGGGAVVDLVREWDRRHGLGDEPAHWLAIQAMDLTARMLAAVLPCARLVQRLEEWERVRGQAGLIVLVPSVVIMEIENRRWERLPRSWNVTSDSIAAWVAGYLGAKCLVLVKSVGVPAGTTRERAVELGVVDPMFARFASGGPRVEWVDLRGEDGAGVVLGE